MFKYKINYFSVLVSLLSASSCLKATTALEDLTSELQLEIMKHGAAKALYAVNWQFYKLAHDQELADKIQHVLPDSQAFSQIEFFLPAVKVTFQASADELRRMQSVCILDVSALNIGINEALVLDQLPVVHKFNLGMTHSLNYYDQASNILYDENKGSGLALFRIMLKDPNYPRRFDVAVKLGNQGSRTDKMLSCSVFTKIMQNPSDSNRFQAASEFCGLMASELIIPRRDINFAYDLLSEAVQDKEKSSTNRNIYASNLLCSQNENHKAIALSFMREVVQGENGMNRSHAALSLLGSKSEADKNLGLRILRELVQDRDNQNRLYDALNLNSLSNNNEDDRNLALSVIREISQDTENPKHTHAIQLLLDLGEEEAQKQSAEKVLDSSQGKEAQVKAFQSIFKYQIKDPVLLNKIIQAAVECVNDISVDLLESSHLIDWLDKETVSQETCLRLLSVINPQRTDFHASAGLVRALNFLLDCPYPDLQKQAEDLFFKELSRFNSAYLDYPQRSLRDIVSQFSEDKRQLWLEKTCDALKSSEMNEHHRLQLACLVINLSDAPQFVTTAEEVLKRSYTENEIFIIQEVSRKFLNNLRDAELKLSIVSKFMSLVESINFYHEDPSLYNKQQALVTLLKQNDKKIQKKALDLSKNLVRFLTKVQPSQTVTCFFSDIGLALSEIEAGKDLAQQIYLSLNPQFETILSDPPEELGVHDPSLKFFLVMGDEKQQKAIYDVYCETIAETDHEYEIDDAAQIIIETMGAEHPWSKEIKILKENRKYEIKCLHCS
jgi:hypothetical protein